MAIYVKLVFIYINFSQKKNNLCVLSQKWFLVVTSHLHITALITLFSLGFNVGKVYVGSD